MNYIMREGIVCRDIAGVYFVIDVFDRHFYRNKQVNCVNRTAYTMISIMSEKGTFSAEDIYEEISRLIAPDLEVTPERIKKDIAALIGILKTKGWVFDAE